MIEWIIECEECDNVSYVKSYNEVCFCPICGMMTEPERQDDIEEELKSVLDFLYITLCGTTIMKSIIQPQMNIKALSISSPRLVLTKNILERRTFGNQRHSRSIRSVREEYERVQNQTGENTTLHHTKWLHLLNRMVSETTDEIY